MDEDNRKNDDGFYSLYNLPSLSNMNVPKIFIRQDNTDKVKLALILVTCIMFAFSCYLLVGNINLNVRLMKANKTIDTLIIEGK